MPAGSQILTRNIRLGLMSLPAGVTGDAPVIKGLRFFDMSAKIMDQTFGISGSLSR